MAKASTSRARRRGLSGFVSGLLGGREIENRVDENFPSWEEFSQQKMQAAQEQREAAEHIELPAHRVSLSSPLRGNFLYFVIVAGAVALGYSTPELAPTLIYVAIGAAFVMALFMVFRDGLFLHLEGTRLQADGDMINRHARGPEAALDAKERGGLLRSLYRKAKSRRIFRSRLFQIHYQNVLRTFEQGNRRTWVDQDASIADLQTLLSQRGMKLVWTVIEVLPLLGLLGTLIGLTHMFLGFDASPGNAELAILSGFGTALGTTVLANLFVLVLRPLYMRNERSMNELLSSMQNLMAMFILPTQQAVLERQAQGLGRVPMTTGAALYPAGQPADGRLVDSLDALAHALGDFTEVQANLDSGSMARETASVAEQTAGVAQEVKQMLQAFQATVDPRQLDRQLRAFASLTEAMQSLSHSMERGPGGGGEPASGRIEHDLTQLRVLTHDTLLLLDTIAGQLGRLDGKGLLSGNRTLRQQVFDGGGLTRLEEEEEDQPRIETPAHARVRAIRDRR